jgi:cold shock CspA family protein
VKYYNFHKGFGFITSEKFEDIFVSEKDCMCSFRDLKEGTVVFFRRDKDKNGKVIARYVVRLN